jgi:hypothetical protein
MFVTRFFQGPPTTCLSLPLRRVALPPDPTIPEGSARSFLTLPGTHHFMATVLGRIVGCVDKPGEKVRMWPRSRPEGCSASSVYHARCRRLSSRPRRLCAVCCIHGRPSGAIQRAGSSSAAQICPTNVPQTRAPNVSKSGFIPALAPSPSWSMSTLLVTPFWWASYATSFPH